jgi:hypothetical protein
MSKTTREFAKVVIKMLSCIPEDDQLKEPLQKILEKSAYKAPELKYGWEEVQECLINRFGEIKIDEQEDWIKKCLNIWKNIE